MAREETCAISNGAEAMVRLKEKSWRIYYYMSLLLGGIYIGSMLISFTLGGQLQGELCMPSSSWLYFSVALSLIIIAGAEPFYR